MERIDDIETEKNLMTDMIEYRIRDAHIILLQARKIERLEKEIEQLKEELKPSSSS